MKDKKKNKNSKSKLGKFMAFLIGAIMISLLTAGYAMTLYDDVIVPVLINNSKEIIKPEENEIKVSRDKNANTVTPTDPPEKTEVKTPSNSTEESQESNPTISVGSINSEHKNDPDYNTYEINVTDAYYTEEVDGKEIRKKVTNMQGGTISVKKESGTVENTNTINNIESVNGDSGNGNSHIEGVGRWDTYTVGSSDKSNIAKFIIQ